VLDNKNTCNLKSERLTRFPNVNSLMKISIGLIFFTILSTAFVYAAGGSEVQMEIDETPVVIILENANLETNGSFFDISTLSVSTGDSILLINNDVVSHKLISGSANAMKKSASMDYDNYIICELGEKVVLDSEYSNDGNDICNFTKDNRIITEEIFPGESISITINDVGSYRIIDSDYPWMEFVIYSFSNSESNNVNSGFPVDDKITEQTSVSEPEPVLTPSIETLSVTVDGMPFDVEYTAIGLSVYEIESDTDSMSLIFYVDVNDSTGTLDVTLDRMFFDSIYDGEDDSFFVLADGDETVSKEIQTTANSRTLTIEIPSGTEELEIIGSVFGITKELPSVIETPVIETPVIETPVIETPVIETPVIETPPTNECGPGTVLENDVCVLDQRCGPGTVLENDVCVLDSTLTKSSSSGNSKELIMGVTVAFVIAGVIGVIFAIISKANRNKH